MENRYFKIFTLLSFKSFMSTIINANFFRGKSNLLFYDLVACGKMGPGVFVDGCPTTQVGLKSCYQYTLPPLVEIHII